MKACVLDASVVAAAFFQEDHADRALQLLAGGGALHAPDLIYAELANVIWKRHGRGEIDPDEAGRLLADFRRLPLEITPCGDLVEAALELALRLGRSVYDCLYLALAVKNRSVMVSADKRLVNALAGTPLAKHIAWIGSDG
jgi:predicted nucleic acid-binding protein